MPCGCGNAVAPALPMSISASGSTLTAADTAMSTSASGSALTMVCESLDDLLARLDAECHPTAEPPPLTILPVQETKAAPASAADVERRQSRRRPAEEFGHDLRLTLPGVAEARPIDISATGVLAETTHRQCPGRTVDLFLRINGTRRVVRARVIRSVVHAISPRPLFRVALQFEDHSGLPECDE